MCTPTNIWHHHTMFEHDIEIRTEIRATRLNETVTITVDTVAADIAIDVATSNGTINGTTLAGNAAETEQLAAGLLAARSSANTVDAIGTTSGGTETVTGSERAALHTLATFIAGADHVEIGDDLIN
jgi:hypothetical protein